MNFKLFGSLIEALAHHLFVRTEEGNEKTSVRIAGVPTRFRTQHLQNVKYRTLPFDQPVRFLCVLRVVYY
jgi:hypothetical protein